MTVIINYPIDPVQLANIIDEGWTHLELFYSNTPDGEFVTTSEREALDADTFEYEFTWASGNYAQWFKVRLYDGSNNSPSSDSRSFHGGGGTTLQALMQETGKLMYSLEAGVTSAAGNTTTAKADHVRFTRRPDDYYQGWFFHNLDNDEWSEITDSTTSAGVTTFTFSPAITSVGSGTNFQIISRWTPEEFRDAINWAIVNNYPKLSTTIVHTGIVVADDTYQYDVPNAIRMVTKVEIEANENLTSESQAVRGHPYREIAYDIIDEGLNQKIEFKRELYNSPFDNYGGRRIRITGTGTLNLLYNLDDYVELIYPQTELISYYAAHRLYALLSNDSASTDVDRFRDQANYFMALYNEKKGSFSTKRKARRRWGHDARWA